MIRQSERFDTIETAKFTGCQVSPHYVNSVDIIRGSYDRLRQSNGSVRSC